MTRDAMQQTLSDIIGIYRWDFGKYTDPKEIQKYPTVYDEADPLIETALSDLQQAK